MKIAPPFYLLGASVCLMLQLAGCQAPEVTTGSLASPPPAREFDVRERELMKTVAEEYRPTEWHDRGKFTFPVVIARMALYGETDERANAYIEEYEGDRYSFFHFPFVGMARIMGMFPEAPAVARLEEGFLERILFHEPDFHYNALTGEGTENHVAMSRTNGYLFAERAKRFPDLRERAIVWERQLKDWILSWSKRIYAYGTGEWDSGVYTTYNMIGWLNLYDFAEDAEVRAAARAVLDYYAANLALKYTQGVMGGPESRAGTQFRGLPRSATDYLAWLWFGNAPDGEREGFFKPSEYIQAVHAATSTYTPPPGLMPLAAKEIPVPALYRNHKPDYLLLQKAESREVFLIEDTYTLGTVETPHGGWLNTAYGVINWKLVMMSPDGLPGVMVGNGGMRSLEHARGRNPFDQFLQHRNVVVQMTRVPENAEAIREEVNRVFQEYRDKAQQDFAARWGREHQFSNDHMGMSGSSNFENAGTSLLYLPETTTIDIRAEKAVGRYADTAFLLQTLSGRPIERDGLRLIDRAGRGEMCGFVIEVINAPGSTGISSYHNAMTSLNRAGDTFFYQTQNGDLMEFRYNTSGSWQEMIYDWGYGVREQRVGFNTSDWEQPQWPSGEGHGRLAELVVNGQPPVFPGAETVISGPQLSLHNRVLVIRGPDGTPTYTVDYRNRLPVFTQP